MARIWQEGFEAGLPHINYMESWSPNQLDGIGMVYTLKGFGQFITLAAGRNAYSNNALQINGDSASTQRMLKVLSSSYSEVYFRVYFKHTESDVDDGKEVISLLDENGDYLMSLYDNIASESFDLKVKTGGTYQTVKTISVTSGNWHKIDFYLKIGNGTGAYEFKLNDVSESNGSSDNTGTVNIKQVKLGFSDQGVLNSLYYDDIALNDTTGSVNNSWCGAGTIVALKPKAAGNYSQFDSCKGYALSETSTSTTTIKITSHGLATNDVIFNVTRNAYRIVTVSDANTLTVSSVTSQAEGDTFLLYAYENTHVLTYGLSSYAQCSSFTVNSGDVFVNTTRSNAIRRIIYRDGEKLYNSQSSTTHGALGLAVSSQAAGDTIKTFKFLPYAITNHYEAVNHATVDPSHKYALIQSNTVNDIDSFDMQELVTDLSLPSNLQVNAVSVKVYAQEAGAGSQFKPLLRISSTDYVGDTVSLQGGTLEYNQVFNVSPATSIRFTQAEVDGLEAGVKVV